MRKFIMAIDQGTTGTRVMIVDKKGIIAASAYTEFPQIYPKPGWVEHNAEIIWDSTIQVMNQAFKDADISAANIQGIGITNQRETSVIWDRKTLKPVYNAIVWQCRRSAGICDEMKEKGLEPIFQKKTGLVLDAYFSGTKVKWILDKHPEIRAVASIIGRKDRAVAVAELVGELA